MASEIDALSQMAKVGEILRGYRFKYSSEAGLHSSLSEVLKAQGVEHEHEVRAQSDRFDFVLPGGVVLEVKIKGSLQSALSQVARYCERPDVNGVALVADTSWISSIPPDLELSGKPVRAYKVLRVAF